MEDICLCGTCPCPCDACRQRVARDQRIREAERAVLACADARFVDGKCSCSTCMPHEQNALEAAVRALRALKKETP